MTPAERYLASFPGGVEELEVRGLDVLDVPLHSAWLVPGPGVPTGSGLGYGATAPEARTGALGEMAEAVLSTLRLAGQERRQASYAELRREGVPVQDPRTLCLEAGSGYDEDRPLQWLPMTRLRDGEPVLVPAELVASSAADLPGAPPPDGWLTTVITNGQGAGLDVPRATAHAVLELLQRDGNAVAFRAMDPGVVLDLDGLRDPDSLALLAGLDRAGIEVQVHLASTDLGVVDVVAVGGARAGDEPTPVMATACGEAAHPDREVAVRKALHEFAAARGRKAFMHGPLDAVRAATPPGYLEQWEAAHPLDRAAEEPRAVDAMLDWVRLGTPALVDLLRGTVLAHRSTVRLAELPTAAPDDLAAHVVGRLHEEGLDVLVDVQPAAVGDAVAVKAQVPGLEVETMSYGRIGERGVRRLLDREDPLVAVGRRPDGPGWGAVHLTDDARERLGGPAWFDRAGVQERVGALYPLYREPGRHVVGRLLAGGG